MVHFKKNEDHFFKKQMQLVCVYANVELSPWFTFSLRVWHTLIIRI